jgi:hypothetical protein
MMRSAFASFILLLALVAGAWPALAQGDARAQRPPGSGADTGPSTVIYIAQSIPLRFNHKAHLAMGMTCLRCHPGAATSRLTSDRLLPAPQVCDGCHGSRHAEPSAVKAGPLPRGACGFCHEGYDPTQPAIVRRVTMPDAPLRSNHQAHAARKIGCGQCHGAVQELALATRDQLPRMRGCYR